MVIEMARAGQNTYHAFCCMYPRPMPIMLPHDGSGGGVPSPKKLKPDSSKIAKPRLSDIWTKMGARIFGSIAVRRIRGGRAPIVRDAST
jgi:hypothetical protein